MCFINILNSHFSMIYATLTPKKTNNEWLIILYCDYVTNIWINVTPPKSPPKSSLGGGGVGSSELSISDGGNSGEGTDGGAGGGGADDTSSEAAGAAGFGVFKTYFFCSPNPIIFHFF